MNPLHHIAQNKGGGKAHKEIKKSKLSKKEKKMKEARDKQKGEFLFDVFSDANFLFFILCIGL